MNAYAPTRITPWFMYGTAWKEADTSRCVLDALRCGFRVIDTANQRKHYFEAAVGDALKLAYEEGICTRQNVFLQTKYTFSQGQDHRLPYDVVDPIHKQVEQSFRSSCHHLGDTSYLDSMLLHGPTSRVGLHAEDWEAWTTMENLVHHDMVKCLGISNVNLDQLKQLIQRSRVKPTFVQNRCHAATGWDKAIREFCEEQGIVYQGFSLLTGNTALFSVPAFRQIVEVAECTPSQAIFAFAIQIGILPITGTTNVEHMKEDLLAPTVMLPDGAIDVIETALVTHKV